MNMHHDQNLELFGKSFSHYKRWTQLAICVIGTLFFHIISGICLEHVFQSEGFHYGIFLTLSQFVIYTILAKVGYRFRYRETIASNREEYKLYILISLFMITTMGLTNYALHLVPF